MSVIIKDMEMPKTCSQCEIWSKCWDERPFWFERLEYCPLTEMADRKTEPQTCSVNGRPYTDCCNCECFKCTADEPQTDCNGCKFVGTYDTEFPCANCSRKTKDYYAKDEPQTAEEWYTYQDEQEYNDRWQTERSE